MTDLARVDELDKARTTYRLHADVVVASALVLAFAVMAVFSTYGAAPTIGRMVLALGLGATLVALSVVDCRTMRLPDAMTLPLIGAGLAVATTSGTPVVASSVLAAIVGYLAFRVLAVGYLALRGTAGLGGGDAKLLGAAGAWTGLDALPTVVFLAAATALVFILVMKAAGRPIEASDRLPFGPFLAIGFWYGWLFGPLMV